MLFDRLKEMLPRWEPSLSLILKEAVLIKFDVIPHEVLKRVRDWTPGEVSRAVETFKLPYPVVAIEDKGGCVVLADIVENQTRLDTGRLFIDAIPGSTVGLNQQAYSDPGPFTRTVKKRLEDNPLDFLVATLGKIELHAGSDVAWRLNLALRCSWYGDKDRLFGERPLDYGLLSKANLSVVAQEAAKNPTAALEEIMHIQQGPAFSGWPHITMFDDTPIVEALTNGSVRQVN